MTYHPGQSKTPPILEDATRQKVEGQRREETQGGNGDGGGEDHKGTKECRKNGRTESRPTTQQTREAWRVAYRQALGQGSREPRGNGNERLKQDIELFLDTMRHSKVGNTYSYLDPIPHITEEI